MALSNADRQRRHYLRQKEKKNKSIKIIEAIKLEDIFKTPFYKWLDEEADDGSEFEISLDMAGILPPFIDDDSDPKSHSGEVEPIFLSNPEDSPYIKGGGSLARAELIVGCLISGAVAMADMINVYKKAEITARIKEITDADFSDPQVKSKALSDIVQLRKMLDTLDKQVRWPFAQWKVTAE